MTQTEEMRNKRFTLGNAKELELLGSFTNGWRQRKVFVYEHPDNLDWVVTYGFPINSACDPVICVEDRSAYEEQIENGWRDTK